MSLLKKFRLTEEGQKAQVIFIPKNALGDALFRKPTEAITDADASELLLRRDGRGKRFVETIPARQEAPKQ